MKCPKCRENIPDNAQFCAKCGAKIPRCPTCGKVITKRIRFCANDGTPIPEDVLVLIPEQPPMDAPGNQPGVVRDTPIQTAVVQNGRKPAAPPLRPSGSSQQHRCCIRCGKPCVEGELLCEDCKRAESRKTDTAPYGGSARPGKEGQDKARLIIILLTILLILIVAGGIVAFVWLNGKNNAVEPQNDSITVDVDTEPDADSDLPEDSETKEDVSNTSGTENDSSTPITNSYADDRSYYGNSFENSSQGGILVASGEWIYYVSPSDNFSIWKMRADGSDQTLVSSTAARHISMSGDYLYYRAFKTGYLHRLNVESGDDTVLVARSIYEPKVVGTYIYYEDSSDDSYDLYRCELDGSNEVKITDGVVFYCCVSDTRIYYLDTRDDRKGYSVALDGSDKQLWFDGRVGSIDYVDGTIYFTDMDNGGLYQMNDGESTYRQISSMTMKSINIYDGWIYFADGDNGGALTKANLSDTSEVVILSTADCELINVCGGWVQYHAAGSEDDEGYYWIPTSGGAVVQF